MRYKVGDWVYRFIGSFRNPFLCEIVGMGKEDVGLFRVKNEPRYILQIPKQEWRVYGSDDKEYNNFVAKTQSELYR